MSGTNESITELRAHLFGALRGLSDKSMDIDRAKAVADVGQVLINSARVEIQHLTLTGGKGTGFIPEPPASALPDGTTVVGAGKGVLVTQHRLKG